jgi:hypothetical protein
MTNSATIDFAADSKGHASKATLDLAVRVIKGVQYVAEQEAKLKEAKAKLRELQEVTLPGAMLADNIHTVTIGGSTVNLENIVSARIPKAGHADAMKWLLDNGHGNLIKYTVEAAFDREMRSEAMGLAAIAENRGGRTTVKEGVHPSTLKAWVKKVVPTGADLPHDLLHIFVGQRAVVAGQTTTDDEE